MDVSFRAGYTLYYSSSLATVSILVLVDVSFRVIRRLPICGQRRLVSILVLVDVSFRASHEPVFSRRRIIVSILVLVDVSFRALFSRKALRRQHFQQNFNIRKYFPTRTIVLHTRTFSHIFRFLTPFPRR